MAKVMARSDQWDLPVGGRAGDGGEHGEVGGGQAGTLPRAGSEMWGCHSLTWFGFLRQGPG